MTEVDLLKSVEEEAAKHVTTVAGTGEIAPVAEATDEASLAEEKKPVEKDGPKKEEDKWLDSPLTKPLIPRTPDRQPMSKELEGPKFKGVVNMFLGDGTEG